MALTYVVKPGDSLWLIARQFGLTVQDIMEANNLVTDDIFVGDVLMIPIEGEEENGGDEPEESTDPPIDLPDEAIVLPSSQGGFVVPEGLDPQFDLGDLSLLARITHAEAKGEPFDGKVAVAAVILNRLKSPLFPNSIYEIIYQPRQFEPVQNGTINQLPDNSAYEAALNAINGSDPSEGALFFWNPYKVPKTSWVWTRPIIKQIGNHVFAR